jgi:hypothetical protein
MTQAVEAGPHAVMRLAAVTAGYLIVAGIMLAPICNFTHLSTASFAGDARFIIWTLAWDNHALLDRVSQFVHAASVPFAQSPNVEISSFFDANIFFPSPNALAYSEHLFAISLFTLPIYAITRNPVLAYNIVWIACYLLTAATAHYLAWRLTGDRLAAFVAGVAWAFCFFRMHHGHAHLHVLWGFWIPLSLIAIDRWTERPGVRRLGLLVAALVLQALASWYQAVLIVVADALYVGWLAATDREIQRLRDQLRPVVAQLVVGAAIVVLLVWPFARHYNVLTTGGPAEAAANSADLAAYLVPPENTSLGQWLISHHLDGPRWIWGEQTLYLGWTIVFLAVAGAVVSITGRDGISRRFRFFVLLAFVALALARGPSAAAVAANSWGWSPFGLLMRIPFLDLFRVPARFAELLTLSLAMLAALACTSLHGRFGRMGRAITVALIPVMLSESYVVKFPGGPPAPFPIPQIYRKLASVPPGAVLSLPDYADTPEWFEEPDYEYFSTAHWHPIANGYSRASPSGFQSLMARVRTFPSAGSIEAMRETGITYVVFHAAAYRGKGDEITSTARASHDLTLLARVGSDYLFEVKRMGER